MKVIRKKSDGGISSLSRGFSRAISILVYFPKIPYNPQPFFDPVLGYPSFFPCNSVHVIFPGMDLLRVLNIESLLKICQAESVGR